MERRADTRRTATAVRASRQRERPRSLPGLRGACRRALRLQSDGGPLALHLLLRTGNAAAPGPPQKNQKGGLDMTDYVLNPACKDCFQMPPDRFMDDSLIG